MSARCGADGSARDSGSRGRRFETCHRDQQFVCLGVAVAQRKSRGLWTRWCRFDSGRSPPSACARTRRELERQRTGLLPRMVRVQAPGDAPHQPPRGGIGRRTGLRSRSRRACPFDSDRGDQVPQSGSSAAEQRPHKAKAGGSCPPRTTKTSETEIGVDAWPIPDRRAARAGRGWRAKPRPATGSPRTFESFALHQRPRV